MCNVFYSVRLAVGCILAIHCLMIKTTYGDERLTPKAMIEALENHNKAPTIEDQSVRSVPRFPVGYNWMEQDRVVEGIVSLSKDARTEVWEYMLVNAKNKSYCVTYGIDDFASNYSIGDICYTLATFRLQAALFDCLDESETRLKKFSLPIGYAADPAAWRRRMAEKQLYELQIEVLDAALNQLKSIEDFSAKERDEIGESITERRKFISMSKKPVFARFYFPGDHFQIYSSGSTSK